MCHRLLARNKARSGRDLGRQHSHARLSPYGRKLPSFFCKIAASYGSVSLSGTPFAIRGGRLQAKAARANVAAFGPARAERQLSSKLIETARLRRPDCRGTRGRLPMGTTLKWRPGRCGSGVRASSRLGLGRGHEVGRGAQATWSTRELGPIVLKSFLTPALEAPRVLEAVVWNQW
jgi:hypothetical protein